MMKKEFARDATVAASKMFTLYYSGELKSHELADPVMKSVFFHAALMGLLDWEITIRFDKQTEDDVEDDVWEAMETKADPEYKRATVYVYPERLLNEDIDAYVRHEMFHILIWFFFDMAQEMSYARVRKAMSKLEEQVVTDLERMPLWSVLYEKTKKEAGT